jgi:uncharacterized SAM-binding protein YcdF (DUF218 family)
VAARKSRIAQILIASALGLCGLYWLDLAARIWNQPSALANGVHADAAIVLGAAVSGNHPGPRFQSRLDYGLDLLQTGRVHYLIITGGVGAGNRLSEGEIGTRYLVQHGADPKLILAEHKSHDTLGNLCFAAPLVRSHGLQTSLIVSDRTHLYRALELAHAIGLRAQPAMSPSPFNSGPRGWLCLLRETLSVSKRRLRGRASCAEVL